MISGVRSQNKSSDSKEKQLGMIKKAKKKNLTLQNKTQHIQKYLAYTVFSEQP